jgi:hypothetical protein
MIHTPSVMKCWLLLLMTATAAFGQGTVTFIGSPIGFPSGSGPNPFLTDTTFGPSVRYQQVYNASDFLGHGAPLYRITDLSFGPGTGNTMGSTTLSNVQISFSITQRSADQLSSAFADNFGLNTTVVSSGLLQLVFNPVGDWNFSIHLQQPFLYDPALGNLLMDVRNYQTLPSGPPGRMAYALSAADASSSLFSYNVNSATGLTDTAALSTRFTVELVPEPSSGLWGLGFGTMLALYPWRKVGRQSTLENKRELR